MGTMSRTFESGASCNELLQIDEIAETADPPNVELHFWAPDPRYYNFWTPSAGHRAGDAVRNFFERPRPFIAEGDSCAINRSINEPAGTRNTLRDVPVGIPKEPTWPRSRSRSRSRT